MPNGEEIKGKLETGSGLELKQFYTPGDLAGWDYEREAGFPGEYPYTRGIYPSLYRGRFWTMRQYAGFRHGDRIECPVPLSACPRANGAFRGLRPSHANWASILTIPWRAAKWAV